MDLERIKDIFELLSYIVVVLGVPAGIWQYRQAKQRESLERSREREERAWQVYDALDDRYYDYLNLCLQYPELDIYDIPDQDSRKTTPQDKKREDIAFTMLLSLFEQAYLMYMQEGSEIRKVQWDGWQGYIHDYCMRDNFIQAWEQNGSSYDKRFQAYMRELVNSLNRES